MTTPERDVCDRARQALEGLGANSDLHQIECYASWLRSGGPRELLAAADRLREDVRLARDGIRPMTDVESNLMTQVLQLRRERAELQREVERLRANQRVEELEPWLGKCKGGQ